jgi:hypothetical protein
MNDADMNLVLMLTERDVTIPDAIEVYAGLTTESLRYVAFKDIGADRGMLQELTDTIHADGRSALLEIADLGARQQEAGMQLALDIGVDHVVAEWSEDFLAFGTPVGAPEYWPFLGSLSGNPLTLSSSPEELVAMATALSRADGVAGLVAMPYRQQRYEASLLLDVVLQAASVPVLVAGGVANATQIEGIARAGAWGFTMGSALLSGRQDDPASVSRRINEALRVCQETSMPSRCDVRKGGTS